MRLKSSQTTDRGERGEAAFYNVSHGVAFAVFVVGCAYLFGGENASELEETFDWIIEIRRRIDSRVHQTDELDDVDLRAWNMNTSSSSNLQPNVSPLWVVDRDFTFDFAGLLIPPLP